MSTNTSGAKRAHSDEPAERRVQPRHFHAGPNPPAASDSDATAVALPPIARFHHHSLERVFAFLRQGELAAALQVSRDWLAAVKSMRSLQLVVARPSAPLFVLAMSALGRHIVELIGSYYKPVQLTVDTLLTLARFMPQLRRLTCHLSLPPAPGPLLFPLALRKLEISLHVTAAPINAALRSMSRLPLLEELTIIFSALDPQISFAPLGSMARLRSLDIRGQSIYMTPVTLRLSDSQVDELRAMRRLQKVSPPQTTADSLRPLLRQPHDLQWQDISTIELALPIPLDDDDATLLPQLPSLTKIYCEAECRRFDWLRGLPNLTDVHLTIHQAGPAGRTQSLIDGLLSCTNIKTLAFHSCGDLDLTATHLADLLPRLPQLRELEFLGLHIDSLSFLSLPPLTLQLSTLSLAHCHQLPLAELRRVHALRGLKKLDLYHSFRKLLDEYGQSLYEPPSLLLPQLEKFIYFEPEDHIDVDSDDDD